MGDSGIAQTEISYASIYLCVRMLWRIPQTEEPGGLQSMWLQRVRHNLATKPPPETNFEGWACNA